jgi:hypothetical protein
MKEEFLLQKNQQPLKLLQYPTLEDNLQKFAYKLTQIITQHGLTTSVEKTKLMAIKDKCQFKVKL